MQTFRITATAVIFIALAGLAVYWYANRPTIQENVVKDFFNDFKKSDYNGAQEFTVDDDFYKMASQTLIRDSDGEQYLIGDVFPENRSALLEIAIESYVKQHIAKWRYLGMDTQKLNENSYVVSFRLDIGVRDFGTGEFLAATIHEGTVEGRAFMVKIRGSWEIQKFDLNIFSDDDLRLKPYLAQVN